MSNRDLRFLNGNVLLTAVKIRLYYSIMVNRFDTMGGGSKVRS